MENSNKHLILKMTLGLLLAPLILFTFTPTSLAYIDSLGRVFPGRKPVAHKTVKKKAVITKKPSTKIAPKTTKLGK